MQMTIETEQEEDGRWVGEVIELPGVLVYGQTWEEIIAKAQALALRVLADRLEHGEPLPEVAQLFSPGAP
jgi:predicted RNase H-like HicB family nuclease